MITGPATLIGAATLILGLFVSGIPIFLCFLALNLVGIWALLGVPAFPMLINSMFSTTTNGQLTAIPLFVLMGEILFRSGATERIFEAVDRFIGSLKGRQYILAGLLSAIFGALSGSNMAVAAMMARTVFPGMIARGYDRRLSMGMILGGASLAPVIPPSVLVIIIATLANVSVAGLLVAGVLPGLMLAALFIGYAMIRIRVNPALAPESVGPTHKLPVGRAVLYCLPFFGLIALILGLILMGVATPSESAAIGVTGSLIIAGVFRRLSLALLTDALRAAALMTAMILIIMASSTLFSQLLAISGASRQITTLVGALDLSPGLMVLGDDADRLCLLHVRRSSRRDADRDPDLPARDHAAADRPALVLDDDVAERDGGWDHPTIRLCDVRIPRRCAGRKYVRALPGFVGLRRPVCPRDAVPCRRSLACYLAPWICLMTALHT